MLHKLCELSPRSYSYFGVHHKKKLRGVAATTIPPLARARVKVIHGSEVQLQLLHPVFCHEKVACNLNALCNGIFIFKISLMIPEKQRFENIPIFSDHPVHHQ